MAPGGTDSSSKWRTLAIADDRPGTGRQAAAEGHGSELGSIRNSRSEAKDAAAGGSDAAGGSRCVCALALVALLAGGWFWFRDSSLVSASHVTVEGESGPDAARIREALRSAAHTMTTLDVDMSQLRSAVAPYPIVKDLEVSTQFPHGLRIHVIEQLAGRRDRRRAAGKVAVAARRNAAARPVALGSLPLIPLRVPPGGARVTDRHALDALALLAAAPAPAALDGSPGQHGTGARPGRRSCATGPRSIFGDASELGAKWLAAAAVLADAGLGGRGLHRRHRPGAARRRRELQRSARPAWPRPAGTIDDRRHRTDRVGTGSSATATAPEPRSTSPPEANPQVELEAYKIATLRPRREFGDLQRSLRTAACR